MSATEAVYVCAPCKADDHLECDTTLDKLCHCLVCVAQKIGDAVMGDGVGDYYRKRRTP